MASSNLEIKIKTLIEGLDSITKLRTALEDVANGTLDLLDGAKDAGKAMDSLASDLEDAAGGLGDIEQSLQDTAAGLQDLGTASEDAASTMQDIGGAAQDAAAGMGEVGTASEDAAAGMEKVSTSAEDQQTKFQYLTAKLKELAANFTGIVKGSSESGNALSSLSSRAKELAAKFQELTGGSNSVGGALSNAAKHMAGMGGEAGVAGTAASALVGALKPLASALAAIAGIKITFDYLKDAANYAAKLDTLAITMGVVGENAGYTKGELKGYEEQLKKAGISTESARDSMIQMMQAGIALGTQLGQTTPQVVQLARAAQDLAVVTGENSSQTLQRMVTNIQQMDTMGLRFMGLMVDMTAAQQKFAEKLGTTAGALTEAQKRQAVLNEVLVQSQKMAGAYELSLESVGKKLGSMTRYVDELKLALGNRLLPAYGALVDAGTDLLKSLGNVAEGFDKSGDIGQQFGRGVKAALDPLVPLLSKIFDWVLQIAGSMAPAFEGIGVAVGAVVDVVGDLFTGLGDGLGVIEMVKGAFSLLGGALMAVADGVLVLKAGFNALIGLVATVASAILKPLAAVADWLPIPDAFVAKIKGAQQSMDTLAGKSADSIGKVSEHFMNGEAHITKWAEAVFSGNKELSKLDPTPAELLKDQIIKLTRAQNDNTMSSVQVAAEQKKIQAALDAAKASGAITAKEYDKLTLSLDAVAKKMKEELDNAFKQLKTSSQELATGISTDAGAIIGALKTIAQNGAATADQFAKAFGDKLSMAKSVEELNGFSKVLDDAKTRWPEAPNLLAQAQGQVSLKFDEILEKQLKALNTGADWATLKAAIVEMGNSGALSVGQVTVALEKGEEAVRRLDPAFVAASQASTQLGNAIKDVDAEIKELDTAIKLTAEKAVTAYTNMANGYKKLAEDVKASTAEQISDIERRFNQEAMLIEKTVTSESRAAEARLDAVMRAEEEKSAVFQRGAEKQLQYLSKQAEAEKGALNAKLAALDEEVAKVEDALGKQKTSRDEYERKMKDLDAQRKQAVAESEQSIREKKQEVMQSILERYKAHIDALNAEEDRHLEKVKSIQQQIEQSKMTMEERIRAIEKSAMSEYEAYQANMSDVAALQSKAREAASRGEYDQAKEYLNQAKSAATELNSVVKDGEKVLVDKQTAAKNAQAALREIYGTEQELMTAQKNGYQKLADTANSAKTQMQQSAEQVKKDIDDIRSKSEKGIELQITANAEQAKTKVAELDDLVKAKERLMPIKADLEQAKQALEKMKADIEAGRTVKVDGDISKAMASLDKLKQYAEQTNNAKLAMDVSQAMAAIDQTKGKVQELNGITASPTLDIKTKGEDQVKQAHERLKELEGKNFNATAEFQAKNADKLDDYIAKIKTVDGKTIYTEASMTGNFEEKAQKIEMIHKELGTKKTTSEHHIDVNDEEAVRKINEAHQKWKDQKTKSEHSVETNADKTKEKIDDVMKQLPDTKSKHDVDTNADETKAKVEQATEKKDVTSKADVETNANEKKAELDKALEKKDVTNKVTIETNASEVQPQIDKVLEEKSVTSHHNVETDAGDKQATLDAALQEKTVTSTHNITTDAETQKAVIDTALEERSVTSTHTIESNATEIKPDLDSVLGEKSVTSHHTIESNATELQPSLDTALTEKQITSQHNVETNAEEVSNKLQQLNGVATSSQHTVNTNADDALSQIMSLNGQATSSTHTIYVVKEYMFAEGGSVGGVPSSGRRKYHYQSSGPIPGAGNSDSVARTLDVGSFVLKKSAVQQHGAGRLLSMIESAKQLPKVAATAMGKVQAMLMPGEIVVGKDVASRLGHGLLSALNDGMSIPELPLKYASGGSVGVVPDYVGPNLDLGGVGLAFAKGGPVPEAPTNVVQVDLRGNTTRASVSVQEDQSKNLLEILSDLRARSA